MCACSQVARVLVLGAPLLRAEGRRGPLLADDPWTGTVTDCGLAPGHGVALGSSPVRPDHYR